MFATSPGHVYALITAVAFRPLRSPVYVLRLVHLFSCELNNLPLDLVYTSINGLKHFLQCALSVVSTGFKVQKVIVELHLIITKGVLK